MASKLREEDDKFKHEPCKVSCFNRCKMGLKNSATLRCSACQVAYYCSDLCQKEHWYKSHKNHCKFLSGKKELPQHCFHDDGNCARCESELVSENKLSPCPYRRINNSAMSYKKSVLLSLRRRNIYCHWTWDENLNTVPLSDHEQMLFKKMNLPFELGELTGKYVDKVDQVFAELITLTAYLDLLLGDAVSWQLKGNCESLSNTLVKLRGGYWATRMKHCDCDFIPLFLKQHDLQSQIVDITSQMTGIKNKMALKIWEVFLLKWSLINCVNISNDVSLIDNSKALSIKAVEEFQICNTDQFLNMKSIINLKRIVITDIVTKPVCSVCSASLNSDLEEIQLMLDPLKNKCILIDMLTFGSVLFCGSSSCKQTICKSFVETNKVLFSKLFMGIRCDNCYRRTASVHRCSVCKGLSYCSKQCQIEDWPFHRKVCDMYKATGRVDNNEEERRLSVQKIRSFVKKMYESYEYIYILYE